MKLRQLIKECNEILDLKLPDESFGVEQGDDARISRLVGCFKAVYDELYRDYAPSLRKTVVQSDGTVDLSAYRLCKVVSLVDGEGNSVPFRYGDNALIVEAGKYNLCYARLPDDVSWDDEVVMPSPVIGERIVVYGILREYFASVNDWTNAKQWDNRYKDALQVACNKTVSRLPVRGWL